MSGARLEWLRGRLYERRDALERLLVRKRHAGQPTADVEALIRANDADIDLVDNGPRMARGVEEAVNAAFIRDNDL